MFVLALTSPWIDGFSKETGTKCSTEELFLAYIHVKVKGQKSV